jgi:deazaflavin-dependent oxidoreductase (nitroreductase family)
MPTPTGRPRPKGLDSPLVPKLLKYGGAVQVRLYRLTDGRIGGRWRIGAGFRKPVPVLLLDHAGRRTGRRYTVPLLYLRRGDDLVVVASQGGLPYHPQWYRNLLAAPDTTVQVGAERRRVRARVASADEKAVLWPLLVDLYADFASYQSWTDRDIPVLVLSGA